MAARWLNASRFVWLSILTGRCQGLRTAARTIVRSAPLMRKALSPFRWDRAQAWKQVLSLSAWEPNPTADLSRSSSPVSPQLHLLAILARPRCLLESALQSRRICLAVCKIPERGQIPSCCYRPIGEVSVLGPCNATASTLNLRLNCHAISTSGNDGAKSWLVKLLTNSP